MKPIHLLDPAELPLTGSLFYVYQGAAAGEKDRIVSWEQVIADMAALVPAGEPGDPGDPGTPGDTGASGRNAGIKYTYSTTTAASDPGAGFLRFNNATLSAATALYISETDADANGLAAYLATFDDSTSTTKGHLIVRKDSDPSVLAVFSISATLTDNGGWDTLTVSNLVLNGAFANGDTVLIEFRQTGDQGTSGSGGAFIALSDAPSSYSGQALKPIRVNAGANGLEFYTASTGSSVLSPDDIPSSPDAMDDEFNVGSLDAKWTWINQSPATISFASGRILFTVPAEAGGSHNNHQITQPTPAGNWTFRCKVGLNLSATIYHDIGFIVRDSTTGKGISFVLMFHGSYGGLCLLLVRWSALNTYAGEAGGTAMNTRLAYLEVSYNGTTLTFKGSTDGILFSTIITETVSSFLTSFNQIGVSVAVENSSVGNTFSLDWFRRIA